MTTSISSPYFFYSPDTSSPPIYRVFRCHTRETLDSSSVETLTGFFSHTLPELTKLEEYTLHVGPDPGSVVHLRHR